MRMAPIFQIGPAAPTRFLPGCDDGPVCQHRREGLFRRHDSASFGQPLPRPNTPLLDQVPDPAALRQLDDAQLRQLADELRAETIDAVSVTGGHLGAGLGVVGSPSRCIMSLTRPGIG